MEIFDKEVIDGASLSQLAEMHNLLAKDLGEKTVKRFPDKTSGKRRLLELQKKKLPTKKKKKVAGSKKMNFNLKGKRVAKFLRGAKPDGSISTRLKLGRILEKGGTFDQIVKKVWSSNFRCDNRTDRWKRKNTYGDIHLLNVECGYGIVEKDGFITLDRKLMVQGE